jgi:hypothetical protein
VNDTAQAAALTAAFWVALALAARDQREPRALARIALGLALGAGLAHLGWAALHASSVRTAPRALLDPRRGYCVLFVPLGLLACAPRGGAARARHLASSLPALPLALAVARLGCLAAGCCLGTPSELPWAARGPGGETLHPVALYDAAGGAALHAALRAAPRALRAGLALAGLGALRLALEPLRASPPLGEPALAPAWLAGAWLAAGCALAARAQTLRSCPCQNGSRSTRFRIFPEPVRGSSSRNDTERGTL